MQELIARFEALSKLLPSIGKVVYRDSELELVYIHQPAPHTPWYADEIQSDFWVFQMSVIGVVLSEMQYRNWRVWVQNYSDGWQVTLMSEKSPEFRTERSHSDLAIALTLALTSALELQSIATPQEQKES